MKSTAPLYTVKSLVGELRHLMESNYRRIEVEGEISGLARPASGHLYFSLKEGNALIRCAFFRNRRIGSTDPEEGMQVQVSGQISVYESRGDLQLIVARLQPAGQGALQRAFELLKKKLLEEGLFDAAHKKVLPDIPSSIGVVTSLSGAALHDIRVTLARRFAIANLIIYPTLVQGEQAEKSIQRAIEIADRRNEVDVLLVARGGGALEDLQAFNSELVARAIFNCSLPVVCGVGHETDFTIADMVADHRAPTPTAAAEMVVPDSSAISRQNTELTRRLIDAIQNQIDRNRQAVDYANAKLTHPTERLKRYQLKRQNLTRSLLSSMRIRLIQTGSQVERSQMKVTAHSPMLALTRCRQVLRQNTRSMLRQIQFTMQSHSVDLDHKQTQLSLMSPMRTLERGYSILQSRKGDVITSVGQIETGQSVAARLRDGVAELEVRAVNESDDSKTPDS